MKTKLCLLSLINLFLLISCKDYNQKLWLFVANYSDVEYLIHLYNEKDDFYFSSKKSSISANDGTRYKSEKTKFTIEVIKEGNIVFSQKLSRDEGTIRSYSAYGGDCIDIIILNEHNNQQFLVLKKAFEYEYGDLESFESIKEQ